MPNSIDGARLPWKNPQKNETKNRISEVINNTIPHRSPRATVDVCRPWNVPSRVISRHH